MTVLNKLSSALNRRDEEPNIELAKTIAKANNVTAVKELIEHLFIKKTAVQKESQKKRMEKILKAADKK